jgi:basic membrane lipoprotein Med (substrate-binding protein (PBP1-ABC) superfamily)
MKRRTPVSTGLSVLAAVAVAAAAGYGAAPVIAAVGTTEPAPAATGGTEPASSAATVPEGAPLRVGLLVPGLTNDGSFNQVALEAAEKLQDEGLIEYEVRERMADPAASEPVVREFAAQGFDLIIGHGIELSEPVLNVAAEFPDLHFTISGGADVGDLVTDNVEAWTYDFSQQGYLSGFVAGSLEGSDPVGIVGGPQLPFIEAAHAGFRLGVEEVNPGAEVLEVYAGSFDDVQRASEAATGLISQGATVLYCSGDGICNGVAAAAAAAGDVLTVGVRGEAGGLAEEVNVASVDLDMYPTFRTYVDRVLSGEFGNASYISGLANRGLVLTPVNYVNDRVPADLQDQVDELVDGLASGEVELPTE